MNLVVISFFNQFIHITMLRNLEKVEGYVVPQGTVFDPLLFIIYL